MQAGDRIDLVLEDQAGRRGATADLLGSVLVLVHGDRSCAEEARRVGVAVHLLTARIAAASGLPPAANPLVIPVAAFPEVPALFRGAVRAAVRAASGEVTVWLDFAGRVRGLFDLVAGVPAAIVVDRSGRLATLCRGPIAEPAVADLAALAASLATAVTPADRGREP